MRYRTLALGFCLGFGFTALPVMAEAARSDSRSAQSNDSARTSSVRGGNVTSAANRQSRIAQTRTRSTFGYSAGVSCVPYARQVTGMEISGNGRDWWHNAAGRYARSSRPEPGAILSFPASGGMRSGHVAVVSRVINSRLIEIDHANWGGPGIHRGSVMRGVDVMDVSANNDWTEVRVQVGWNNENFGRPYPTHGFILNRTDTGSETQLANYTNSSGRSAAVWHRSSSRPAIRTVAYRPAANRPAVTATTGRPAAASAATIRRIDGRNPRDAR
jgi:surface antigen